MKKRLVCMILAVVLACCLSTAGFSESRTGDGTGTVTREELQRMSVEDLLALQALIDEVLADKGHELYVEISHGDKGDHVTRLQTRLKELGYYTGRISGKYDNLTEKAVKAFQKENGLPSSSTATQEMQALLYSTERTGTATAAPKATATPAPTMDPTFSAYGEIDYRDCARNPEKHMGEKVKLVGTVVQVMGTKESSMVVRLKLSGGDIVYLNIRRGTVDYNILENDRLIVYATMKGLKTYTSTMNQSITIPQADADYIILQ